MAISNSSQQWRGRLARSFLALIPLLTTSCAYRESSNGDSYVSRIIFAEPPSLRSSDEAISRNSIDVNINPNVPNP